MSDQPKFKVGDRVINRILNLAKGTVVEIKQDGEDHPVKVRYDDYDKWGTGFYRLDGSQGYDEDVIRKQTKLEKALE